MSKKIRLAIAEDHDLVRQGIVNLLNEEEHIVVVSDVSNGSELLNEFKNHSIDIVLMDLEMPIMGGKEALQVITARYPATRVIMLSMHYSDDFIIDCISVGARGFLPKNCDIEKVIDAIYAVHEQGYYFDDKMSKALLFQVMENKDIVPTFTNEPLSKREMEIVKMICNGKINKEIAEALCLSSRTVEVHRKNIARKTKATNVAGVVIYAIKHGLFKI